MIIQTGTSCSISSRPSVAEGGRVCFPRELCGAHLSPPTYYGTLVRRGGGVQTGILTAFLQENASKGTYILYGADEHMNIVQMLRPREHIRMLPESGEVVLEATSRVEFMLSRPYFIDGGAAVTY